MKRFLKHFLYLLFVLPLVLLVVTVTHCTATSEVVEQYGVLTKVTITEADGTVRREDYAYTHGYTAVTIEHYENDVLVRTEERAIAEDDPLLHDTFEVLPHPTATSAVTRCEDNTVYYYDTNGNAEGRSELVYNTHDRLAKQTDYDAEGNLLRTTVRQFALHTVSVSNLFGK